MADDDLFSLDFTMPGAEPEPVAAPVKPTTPALTLVDVDAPPPAPIEESAPAPVPPRLQPPPALHDAAQLFAAGDSLGASRRLEAALRTGERLGEFSQRTWLALFDLLQALNRRDAFDKLAVAYATRFESSAPTWRDVATDETVPQTSIKVFPLPNVLDASIGEALRGLIQAAAALPQVKLDARALVTIDDSGSTLLLRALLALRKAGKRCLLEGGERLLDLLAAQLAVGTASHEVMWLLQLDLLQLMGRQDAFEEAAVNYAVSFERSPPSWDALRVANLPAAEGNIQSPPESLPSSILHGEVIAQDQHDFAEALIKLGAADELIIDATTLRRIDDASAAALGKALQELAASGRRIVLTSLPQLIEITLAEHGVDAYATLHLRKY